MREERGDVVVGWLVRVSVILLLLGISVFDVVSVGFAHVGASDDASNAARLASERYLSVMTRGDVEKAYQAAAAYVEDRGGSLPPEQFTVYADGTVELTVTKTATTVLLYRIGPIKHWADVSESSKAKSLPSS